MRRQVLLMTCLLSLITSVALLAAGALVAAPTRVTGPHSAPSDAAELNAALVRRFYDAVNATLATGDPAPLSALVAADFADRAAPPGQAPTRDGLLHNLRGLRATFPTLWLVVEDVRARGDWVLARVRAEGVGHGEFLGLRFSGGPAVRTGLDVYRVTGGTIAERFATAGWPILPQPLVQVPLPEPPHEVLLRLARFTFAPGARQPAAGSLGPLLVAVEVGTLTVQVDRPATLTRGEGEAAGRPLAATVSPGSEVALRPGDALLLPSGGGNMFRNAEPTPAVVLVLALLRWSEGSPDGKAFRWPSTGSPDVTAQLLAESVAVDMPAGPSTIALGRFTLAAQAELSVDGATGPSLAVVEAGFLELATTSGPATLVSAGQGTGVGSPIAPTFRNAGDGLLHVLLATITPAIEAPAGG